MNQNNNEQNILNEEELETMTAFFNIFKQENGNASINKMMQSLDQMEEFNTSIILKVLQWVKKKNKSNRNLNRNFSRDFYKADRASTSAFRRQRKQEKIFQVDFY